MTRDLYFQLLFGCLSALPQPEGWDLAAGEGPENSWEYIRPQMPAILRPVERWTGKQVEDRRGGRGRSEMMLLFLSVEIKFQ